MKRFLSFLLVLLVLAGCAGAEDAPAAASDAESLRSFLEEHYGVTILLGDECRDVSPGSFEYSVIPAGVTPFQQMVLGSGRYLDLLMVMDDAFSLYSHEFYQNMTWYGIEGGLRFLLVDELSQDGRHIDGIASFTGKDYFNIWLSTEYFKEWVIHHEMWHAMEVRILCQYPEAFDDWADLNPEGFAYTGVFSGDAEPEDWFVREYSKANEHEDRATVFETLMMKDSTWWETRPHLRKKAEVLTEWCRKMGVFDE